MGPDGDDHPGIIGALSDHAAVVITFVLAIIIDAIMVDFAILFSVVASDYPNYILLGHLVLAHFGNGLVGDD